MVWRFIGVYIINRTLHDRLEIRNYSSRVEKYFTGREISKFRISARPCNILYLTGKLYLWDCRKNQLLLNIEGFKYKVRIKYQVEKYISAKNNKLETFYKKWPKDLSPL